jgi:hypothetical protein
MSTNISNHLASQSQWLQSSQIAQISSLKPITILPGPTASLNFCRSLRNRRRVPALMDAREISKLQTWHNNPTAPSTLIAQSRGLRTSATEFAVDYVDILREKKRPVVWVLPHTNIFEDKICSLSDMLLVLVMQILELYPKVLVEGTFPVTIHHFQDIEAWKAESEERSFVLLKRCLEAVEKLYILVDMALIKAIVNDNSATASGFLTRLQEIVSSKPGGGVKLVLASWKSVAGETGQQFLSNGPQVYVDGPLGGFARRNINRSGRMLAIGRSNLGRSLH